MNAGQRTSPTHAARSLGPGVSGLDLYAARVGFLGLGNTQFQHPILEIGIYFRSPLRRRAAGCAGFVVNLRIVLEQDDSITAAKVQDC